MFNFLAEKKCSNFILKFILIFLSNQTRSLSVGEELQLFSRLIQEIMSPCPLMFSLIY